MKNFVLWNELIKSCRVKTKSQELILIDESLSKNALYLLPFLLTINVYFFHLSDLSTLGFSFQLMIITMALLVTWIPLLIVMQLMSGFARNLTDKHLKLFYFRNKLTFPLNFDTMMAIEFAKLLFKASISSEIYFGLH